MAIVISEETVINGAKQLESVPLIVGLENNYMLGQYLDVNCSLPQVINERISSRLQWLIHNEKVRLRVLISLDSVQNMYFGVTYSSCIDSMTVFLTLTVSNTLSLTAKCKVRSPVFH